MNGKIRSSIFLPVMFLPKFPLVERGSAPLRSAKGEGTAPYFASSNAKSCFLSRW
jgi:hypothetical protein